jgi:hypothetical protein
MPKVTPLQIFAAMNKTNQKYTTTNTVKNPDGIVVEGIVFIIPEPAPGVGKVLHYIENGEPKPFRGTIEQHKTGIPFVAEKVSAGGKSRRRKSRRVRRTIRRTRNNYFY